MKSVFISTKLRTTDNIDWASPLKSYLSKIYGSFTDFSKETNIINKLRIDLNTSDDDSSNRLFLKDLYYKYYGQLELLDLRLPVNDHGVRVKFTWYDSYDSSTHYTQHSLAFEKASILFNLAAILSLIAGDNFDQGDYKSSYQYFQYSAGVYKFISENFLHAPSQDLDGKTVSFLQNLQLAQAQEVFLLKLISEDSSKKSLISKLSSSASVHYDQALTALEKIEGGFGEKKKWTNNIKFKHAFYQCIAFYNYALSIEEKKIGESIAFLKLTLQGFDAIRRIDNQTSIDYKTYQSQVEDKTKSLTRDNDFIYHDLIPSKESIDTNTAIKPLDAAKAISLNDHARITEIIGEDIFEKIIPMAVHEKLSLYSEEKAQILRGEIEKNETADTELSSFLEYLNLPGSLDNFKNNMKNKLDPKLVSWSNEINDSQLNDIEQNKSTIQNKKSTVLNTIKDLESKLQDEENDFNSKRAQLGVQQESSSSTSANLRDELTNAKQSLLSAAKLDQQINSSIGSEITRLNQLKSIPQLEQVFFQSSNDLNLLDIDDSSNDNISKHITRIETSLQLLNNLKLERSKIIGDLKIAIHDDDISNILILNNKKLSEKDEKVLFTQELTKFEPYTNRLDSIIFKQPQIIKEVKVAYDEILSSSSQINERTSKIKAFEGTYKKFQEYESNYLKSLTFYDNLISFVNDVKSNVEQFIRDRYSQRDRLLESSRSNSIPQSDPLLDRFNELSVGSTQSQSPRGSYSSQPPLQPRQPSYPSIPSSPYEQPKPPSYYDSNPSPQLPPKPGSYFQQPSQPTPPAQYNSYQDRAAPPLPPKFDSPAPQTQGYQYQSYAPPSGYSSLQQPLQPQSTQSTTSTSSTSAQGSNRVPFYNTPSTFEQGMYKTFGQQQQQGHQSQGTGGQQQPGGQQGPRFSYAYDPNRPYQ